MTYIINPRTVATGLLMLASICSLGQHQYKTDTATIQQLIDSAFMYNDVGIDPEAAIRYGERAVELAEAINSERHIAMAETEIANGYFTMRDIENAKIYALRAQEKVGSIESPKLRIAVLSLLANIASVEGDYEQGLLLGEDLLLYAEKHGTPRDLAAIQGNMSQTLWSMGDYERSMRLAFSAKDYFEKEGLVKQLAVSYNNIGEKYRSHFEDYDNAIAHYNKAAAINEELGDWRNLSMNLGNMALAMMADGRYDSAETLLNRCAELEKNGVNLGGKAHRLNSLGSLNLHLGNFEEARSNFQEVKEICEGAGIMVGVFHSSKGLGAVADTLGDYSLGQRYFDTAAMLSEMSGSNELRSVAQLDLYNHHKLAGNMDKALASLEKYHELKDTLDAEISKRQVASLRIGYETTIKEKENEALLADSKVKESKIGFQRRIQWAAFAVIAVLLLLASMLYRSGRLRNAALKQVNFQKMELERKNAALAEMDKMKNTVFSVVAHDLRGPVANVKGMLDVMEMGRFSVEEQKRVTQGLKQDVKQTLTTMENLLTWAKTQMSGTPTRPTVFDLDDVVQECVNIYGIEAREKEISISIEGESAVSVYADEEQVRSILRNLISNAIKFSDMGRQIKLIIAADGQRTNIIVEDDGIGFNEMILENMDNSSFAISTRGTKGEPGTGIGLQVVKEFVLNNKGTFKISKKATGGSVVSVDLPRKAA